MHIELMELNFESLVEVMWAVQFFAQVIVNLRDGAQAFIEAEGPDVILALNKASPPDLNFFHIHTLDGPQPYIWGNAAKVLSQYPATAAHDLLAVLRKDSPSRFPTSREFVKEAKAKMKSQAKVSYCSPGPTSTTDLGIGTSNGIARVWKRSTAEGILP
jgi:hypothetical protein